MVRRYKLKERALSQQETRERIVRATVALHENPGPRATTISAIAKRAGVQRLTVYRHFPDEASLFKACSSHWFAENPAPDRARWAYVGDPQERARVALLALYTYFRASRRMLTSAFRDDPFLTIKSPLDPLRDYLNAIANDLSKDFGAKKQDAAATTLRHAVQFQTWSSFAELGLSDAAAAKLVVSWLKGIPAR